MSVKKTPKKRKYTKRKQLPITISEMLINKALIDNADEPEYDEINTIEHPLHYGGEDNPFETIKVIEAWALNFNLGNALKYISRAGKKGHPVEDLRKAIWYIQREVDNIEQF